MSEIGAQKTDILNSDTSPTSLKSNMMTMAPTTEKPTLGYWNIRGLGSQIRYEMVYLGIDYDEHQYEQGGGPEYDRS